MAFLLTVRHAGFAGPADAASSGGGKASGAGGCSTCTSPSAKNEIISACLFTAFGFQSGAYSPPAPCFDFTAISSAISLRYGWLFSLIDVQKRETLAHNCSARRSSLSLPTSWSRIRTSEASALLKSFKYLLRERKRKSYSVSMDHPSHFFDSLWRSAFVGWFVGHRLDDREREGGLEKEKWGEL